MLESGLAAIHVDAQNCFGRLEWSQIRKGTAEQVPELGPLATWKHSMKFFVEQPGVEPQEKDRRAEQGDSLGPAETGIALAKLGRGIRQKMHLSQAQGTFPWAAPSEKWQEVVAELEERGRQCAAWEGKQPSARLEAGSAERQVHPGNNIQSGGGVAGVWYLDDATLITRPQLALPWWQGYDKRTEAQGGKRNLAKTVVTLYVSEEENKARGGEWKVEELAKICT